jgi:putative ABC transport system permease protein
MKQIVRNFIIVLKRFTTSSILNIVGLAVAFAVFYIIAVQVYYDFRFDRNFKNADDIYLVTQYHSTRANRQTTTTIKHTEEFAPQLPSIQGSCAVRVQKNNLYITDDDGNVREFFETVTVANAGLLDVFDFDIIAGDAGQVFTENNTVMLTESMAKKLFGNKDPLGKTFLCFNTPKTVVAVCRDFPDNCSLKNGVYTFHYERSYATAASYELYIKIFPGNRDKILDLLNHPTLENSEAVRQGEDPEWVYELTALPDIHLKFPATGTGDMNTTVSLMATGILLLLIAYINFVNFSVAMAPVRLKGFYIRRIMGESEAFLRFTILTEALLFSFIAFVISLFLIQLFNSGVIKSYFQADLSLLKNLNILCAVAGTAVIMGILYGVYLAFYSTRFKPAMAISGSFSVSSGSKILKNTLIGFQFMIAVALIIISIFIKVQHNYMADGTWELERENIVYVDLRGITDVVTFENEKEKSGYS